MAEYTIFALVFAASASTPGPETLGILSRALSGRPFASLPLALGIIIGKLIMLTAAILGLTALAEILGPIFVVLKYFGTAYLFWLGIKKWRNASKVFEMKKNSNPINLTIEIGLGLVLTLSNPIAIVFYIALLPGVVDASNVTLNSYIILCFIIVCMMLIIMIGYSLIGVATKKMFSSPNFKIHFDRLAGALMIGAAILMVIR
ncbi:LysE family translocator [Niallia sp. 01092]|uniref:LysE family translocator n=1 Tax=unclassified Niallia TaxID=2837522 RepID=UPI003FD5ACD7